MRALLRRAHGEGGNEVIVGRLRLELEQKRAWWQAEEVTLSGREYVLLEFLALHAGGYYPREVLLEHVWPGDTGVDPRTVDTYIRYLRRKVDADEVPLIHTVRGVGYSLRLPRNA